MTKTWNNSFIYSEKAYLRGSEYILHENTVFAFAKKIMGCLHDPSRDALPTQLHDMRENFHRGRRGGVSLSSLRRSLVKLFAIVVHIRVTEASYLSNHVRGRRQVVVRDRPSNGGSDISWVQLLFKKKKHLK